MLTVSKITSFDELLKLEDQWNDLVKASMNDNPFVTFEWISNWWKYFGDDKKMNILLVKQDDKLIGAAPLMISRFKLMGLPIKKMEFIGMPLADYSDYIISEKKQEVLQKISESILNDKKIWNFVKLDRIPEKSFTNSFLDIEDIKKMGRSIDSHNSYPVIFADSSENLKNEIQRRKEKRYTKRFLKKGNVTMAKSSDDIQNIVPLINKYFEFHKQKWNNTNTPSMYNDKKYVRFFTDLIVSLIKKDKGDLYYLNLDLKPVAFIFTFKANKTLYAYSTSYDIQYSKYSPGIILLNRVLESYLDSEFKEFDFMRGSENFKLTYANKMRTNRKISIHRNPILNLMDKGSNAIERKIVNNKKLYNFFIKYEKKLRFF